MGLVTRNQTQVYNAWHDVSMGAYRYLSSGTDVGFAGSGCLVGSSSHGHAVPCEQEGGLPAHEHDHCCAGNPPDIRCFLQGCEKFGKNNNM